MPNRILRDWTDSLPVDSLDPQAEVFFVRVIMKADDYGRFSANPKLLRSLCFPLRSSVREADISRWMTACHKAGLLRLYVSDGKPFLQIERFGQQQRSRSKYPEPESDSNCLASDEQLRTLFGVVGVGVSVVECVSVPLAASSASAQRKDRATEEELKAYCKELRLPESDGSWLFHKWEGNGWKNGNTPIKDWKATVRSWNAAGYMASQKAGGGKPTEKTKTIGLKPEEMPITWEPTDED